MFSSARLTLPAGVGAGVAAVFLAPAARAQDVPDPVYAAQDAFEAPDVADPFLRPQRPELASVGVRLGSFTLRPSVELSAIGNSNVRLLSVDQGADIGLVVQPSATLTSDSGRYRLRAFATGTAVRYAGKATENVEQLFGGVRIDRPLGPTAAIRASIEGGRFIEDRAALFSPRDSRSPIAFERVLATVSGIATPGRFVIAPSIEVDRLAYHDNRRASLPTLLLEQRTRSFTRITPAVLAGYTLSADTAVYVGGEVNRRDFDVRRDIDRDSQGWRVYAGARFRPTPLTRVEFAAGYLKQEYRAPLRGPSVPYFRASLAWVPTGLTTLRFDIRRDSAETGTVLAGGAIRTRLRGEVTHELLRNLNLAARVEHARFSYSTLDRVDDRTSAGVDARYVASRRFDLFARADQVFVSTGDPAAALNEFSRTQLIVGLAWKL
ncbi:MAG TPA: outer membrane beta-barrel protein [Sphingomonas sp.]|jgi:hypothetical protein|uniref:outer membrane beta-barrel protein n=1 Tax=Sphingomonas sp. TaxID=28214 RepID=UPI002ED81388